MNSVNDKLINDAFRIIDDAALADEKGQDFNFPSDAPWEQIHRALYDSGDHKAIRKHVREFPEGKLMGLIRSMAQATSGESHLNTLDGRLEMYRKAFGKEV